MREGFGKVDARFDKIDASFDALYRVALGVSCGAILTLAGYIGSQHVTLPF